MAHIAFDQAEQREFREAVCAKFPRNPELAYVLENLALEGIDLNGCRYWDDIRAEKGMPEWGGEASDVA
ncbi:hypothetical protein ACFW96_11420 [Streptomyces gardneri]|uniref:hypothetical protein n=1 Tax=Streptomyces gardneri TaxID=66892 RepID=UPI0036ADD4E9